MAFRGTLESWAAPAPGWGNSFRKWGADLKDLWGRRTPLEEATSPGRMASGASHSKNRGWRGGEGRKKRGLGGPVCLEGVLAQLRDDGSSRKRTSGQMVLECVCKKHSAQVGCATQDRGQDEALVVLSGLGVISGHWVPMGLGSERTGQHRWERLLTHFLARATNRATVQSAQGEASLATRAHLGVYGEQAEQVWTHTCKGGSSQAWLPGALQGDVAWSVLGWRGGSPQRHTSVSSNGTTTPPCKI